jgi:ribonuclease HII
MSTQRLIIGVDEAGRGPLAGPVTAGAVILNPEQFIAGLNDSKLLSEKKRDELAPLIKQHAIAWSVASASVEEIDALNILQATFLAMRRAIMALPLPAHFTACELHIQVDGNRLPCLDDLPFVVTAEAIVEGDVLVPAISAASILAKTTRDAEMLQLDQLYPGYGLAGHKGYGTAAHLQALRTLGACPVHRRSFAPVRAVLR